MSCIKSVCSNAVLASSDTTTYYGGDVVLIVDFRIIFMKNAILIYTDLLGRHCELRFLQISLQIFAEPTSSFPSREK